MMPSLSKVIFLLLLIGFSTTCWATKTDSVKVTSKALEINASITPVFRKFNNGKSKIEGKITITNRTSNPQKYGNEYLQLKVNGRLISRTYKESVASEAIDFTVVQIKPHTTLSLSVYWVFDAPRETEVNSVQLFLDEKGVKKVEGITRP